MSPLSVPYRRNRYALICCSSAKPDSLYEVRLKPEGSFHSPGEGIVEVLVEGCWASLCSPLGLHTPNVICKQLGYKHARLQLQLGRPSFNQDDKLDVLQREAFHCKGSEENLVECPHNPDILTPGICGSRKKATLQCEGKADFDWESLKSLIWKS